MRARQWGGRLWGWEPFAREETLCLTLSMEQPEGLAREPGKGIAQREGTRDFSGEGRSCRRIILGTEERGEW